MSDSQNIAVDVMVDVMQWGTEKTTYLSSLSAVFVARPLPSPTAPSGPIPLRSKLPNRKKEENKNYVRFPKTSRSMLWWMSCRVEGGKKLTRVSGAQCSWRAPCPVQLRLRGRFCCNANCQTAKGRKKIKIMSEFPKHRGRCYTGCGVMPGGARNTTY